MDDQFKYVVPEHIKPDDGVIEDNRMDDQFKYVVPVHIKPDNSTIEDNLFCNALTLLCWGLVLLNVSLDFQGLELSLYSTWGGVILLMLGLWMLRQENRQMATALRCGVLLLLIRTATYWLSTFPDPEGPSTLLLAITTASFLVLTVYYLFSGLRDFASRFVNEMLEKQFIRCFWLYFSLVFLLLVCVIIPFPFLAYLLIPYALFVMIYLPISVSKLKQYVPLGKRVTSVKAINKWVIIALCFYTAATISGEFGCLYYVNAPRPEAQLYSNFSSSESNAIRERLTELRMPEYVLNDLPDDEVLLYKDVYRSASKIMESGEITNRDGGRLEIYSFVGIMPEGKVRTLFYYRWHELPKHTYTELFSIISILKKITMQENWDEKGLSLYDKDGKTYSQTLLNNGALIGYTHDDSQGIPANVLMTQIQFRLYPNYKNQRGYVASSTEAEQLMAFENLLTYIHQESLWNRPHFDALKNRTFANGYNRVNNPTFWSEGFFPAADYQPIDWEWSVE